MTETSLVLVLSPESRNSHPGSRPYGTFRVGLDTESEASPYPRLLCLRRMRPVHLTRYLCNSQPVIDEDP